MSAARVRDLIMFTLLAVWLVYAGAAVVQLFTSGATVLSSLPPFWFWGIPLAPYTALYGPWTPGHAPPTTPSPPEPPVPPEVVGR